MWHEKRLLGVEGHKWWWTEGEWKAVFSLPSPKGSEATVLPVTAQTPSSINMKCLVHKRCFRLFPRISWAQRSVVAWLSWKKLKLVIPRPCEPAAGGHEVTSHSAPREREIVLNWIASRRLDLLFSFGKEAYGGSGQLQAWLWPWSMN